MRKIKVRIAVAVDKDGNWCSAGWAGAKEKELQASAFEGTNDVPVKEAFIEAEVEIPDAKPETLQGTVIEN